jgi:hypothetical protein
MSPRKKKRWAASAAKETYKLKNKENDWKLNGDASSGVPSTRTRKGGSGRPNLARDVIDLAESSAAISLHSSFDESEDSDWTPTNREWDTTSSSEEDEEALKPSATRVIMEVIPLKTCMEKTCRCQECDGPVEVFFRTICIATSFMLCCKNPRCGYVYYSDPPAQVTVERGDNRERSTDYALNILYVLGFIACGDGCTEAARILGLLGLPNDTTMETRSFNIIEDRLSMKIQEVTKEILEENLAEEVRLAMEQSAVNDHNDFELWKQLINNKQVRLSEGRYPRVTCSFDMGWQQRSSGHRYNSQSGHALLVGSLTRKPIALELKSKRCNYCITWKKKNPDLADGPYIPLHSCTKNHTGTSGSMEPQACLDMVVALHENYSVVVEKIVIDDDASTRSVLKWTNADYMKNNETNEPPTIPISKGKNKGKPQARPDRGRLPATVPEPLFVADPNHRRNVLTGELIALTKEKVANKFTMTKMDATRIGKNFSYMIRQLPTMHESQYEAAGKAVLEHHFDNHSYCGPWCPRKRNGNHQGFYRSKSKDSALYEKLKDIVARFVTVDRLKEVAHGMDTQVNESFNNTFSWLAPKNKIYCGSQSLKNRLCIGIGINGLGMEEYFRRLFKKLGIVMTANVAHFLKVKGTKRINRLDKLKLPEKKRNRLKDKTEKLRKDTAVAIKERSKRDGTYKKAQGMADDSEEEKTDDVNRRPRITGAKVCRSCGKKGHLTVRSKHCLNYAGTTNNTSRLRTNVQEATETDTQAHAFARDIDDAVRMDNFPLTDDPPSDLELDEFQDCNGWDSDIEDVGIATGVI